MLYFNDSVAVGFLRNGFLEVAAQDPQQGVIFYVLQQLPGEKPLFTREEQCLSCHHVYDTLGVPGMLVRSQFTGPTGVPMRQLGNTITDHRSPFEDRWGGWYVTGKPGSLRHLGNAVVSDPDHPETMITEESLHLESLEAKLNTASYLSPYSDIVALMVFNHQMHMINLITRVGWEVRFALYEKGIAANSPVPKAPSADREFEELVRGAAVEFVDYLLFVDEAPLPGKVEGTSGFAEAFAAGGPNDQIGRSLRQFDLERRLMRYPWDYMIYTPAFDGLPLEARDAIYRRMWQILSGEERTGKYERLSLADRQAVVEILRATKDGLPDYFQPVTR